MTTKNKYISLTMITILMFFTEDIQIQNSSFAFRKIREEYR